MLEKGSKAETWTALTQEEAGVVVVVVVNFLWRVYPPAG